jgi:DNA invertase Pin-like site-specific DNA recombinase
MNTVDLASVYLRISKGDPKRQKSVGDQLDEARKFAKLEGAAVADDAIYTDDGISGRTVGARPELNRLLDDVKSGRLKAKGITVLICWGVDRLGRNLRESLNVQYLLMQHGIRLMAVRENCKPDDDGEGKIHFAIEALIAESYSDTLGKLARRGHQDAALKGKFWAPTAPYGYCRVKGGIAPDPKEAELVREVFRLFLEGRSRHSIARMFKERKTAKRGGSLDWCTDEITRMLTSDAVIGIRVYKGVVWDGRRNVHNEKDKKRWVVTPNAHEAIIDLNTFVRVQRLIRERNKNLNFNAVRKHFSTLGGVDLLACGKCGASYTSNIGPGFRMRDGKKVPIMVRSYVCGRRSRHKDCDNRSVRQEVLDGVVLRRIAAYVRDADAVRQRWQQFQKAGLEKLIPLRGKITAVEAEIGQLEQKEARLVDAYGTGHMLKDIFGKHLEEVGRRLKALREDRRLIKKRLAAFDQGFDEQEYLTMLEDFHTQFGALPPESRKMLLKQLIKKITINGPYEFVIETTFLPEPVSFPFGQDYQPPSDQG